MGLSTLHLQYTKNTCRWLEASDVSIPCEKGMRQIALEVIGDN